MTTKNKKKLWWLTLILPIALFAMYLIKPNLIYLAYYSLKADHFKTGDEVYIKNTVFGDLTAAGCLYRSIRPLTLKDTLDHYLTPDQIAAIRSNTNSLEPYIIRSTKVVLKDRLIKYHSYIIGHFNGSYARKMRSADGSELLMNFTSIKLNYQVCTDYPHAGDTDIPPNYTLADSSYYVYSQFVSNKNFYQ